MEYSVAGSYDGTIWGATPSFALTDYTKFEKRQNCVWHCLDSNPIPLECSSDALRRVV